MEKNMDRLKQLLQEQPALITAVVEAALAMGAAFGLNWSAEQVATVLAFVNLIGGIAVYMLVMPMSKVKGIQRERDVAFEQTREAHRQISNTKDLASWLVAEKEHQLAQQGTPTVDRPRPLHVERPVDTPLDPPL